MPCPASSSAAVRQLRRHRTALFALAALGLFSSALLLPTGAAAAVQHGRGLEGTVLGWTSWYGSYELAGIGPVWCIDHGLRAPDADLGYRRTDPGVSPEAATAMAWTVGRHGGDPDPIDAAAVMLVLHDLRGAVYPQGRLDLGRMTTASVAGFSGRGAAVLARARAIKADALQHAGLRWPLALDIELVRPASATSGEDTATGTGLAAPEAAPRATASVVDAAGRPVAGITVTFALHAASSTLPLVRVTGVDGTTTLPLATAGPDTGVQVQAVVPDLRPVAYAPTTKPAQRVIRPTTVALDAAAALPAPPPTTTTSTTTTTTTSTTLAPSTTTTTTTAPRPTTPASARPTPTSVIPIAVVEQPMPEPPRSFPPPSASGHLAQTGTALRPIALVASALILMGVGLQHWKRRT
jgi:hypothetical protein